MPDNKNHNGNEINTDDIVNSTDSLFDNARLGELRKKYDVVDYDDSMIDKPKSDSANNNIGEITPSGVLKEPSRQFHKEAASAKDTNEVKENEKPDNISTLAKDDVNNSQTSPAGTPEPVLKDAHFDAFPTFLHISEPDIPTPQVRNTSIDMILSELAELEAKMLLDTGKVQEETLTQNEQSLTACKTADDTEHPDAASTPDCSQPEKEESNMTLPQIDDANASEPVESEEMQKADQVLHKFSEPTEGQQEQGNSDETKDPEKEEPSDAADNSEETEEAKECETSEKAENPAEVLSSEKPEDSEKLENSEEAENPENAENSEADELMKEFRPERMLEEMYLDMPFLTQQPLNNDTKTAPFTVNIDYDFEDEFTENSEVKNVSIKRHGNIFPQKGDGIGESIRKIVLIIAVLTMIVCAGILINIYVVSPEINKRQGESLINLNTTNTISTLDWPAINAKYPNIDFPSGMQIKFAESYALNKDFVGWLKIKGAEIDMPIVQSENNEDYLKKTFNGKKSKYGCCFMDYKNNPIQLDLNTVVYGHNMSYDDLMFGKLENYRKIEGFKAAPLIEFDTLFSNYKWKIYAVFISNGKKSGDGGYVFNYIFQNLNGNDIFRNFIKDLDQRKLYTTGVDILTTDKIITLSTCCYDFDSARLVVVARMLREGESEDVNTSIAVLNNSPRYPQAWYTEKGLSNPYKNADKWYAS